ncbi:MAG TPA: TIGR03915 family putative DNA repair protein [Candidatus Hydrogenedens sp.]|nr:TIGR03915 family putative DNA repair protein [Candidatus Hydrogenedens sp.]
MNFNLPDKTFATDTELSLFPQKLSKEKVVEELQKATEPIQKILYYFSLAEHQDKYELASYLLDEVSQNSGISIDKINDPVIYQILKVACSVQRQIHRLEGLIRFREIKGGYLYAAFAPDFDVIMPIATHFASRFPQERFILHDTTHKKIIYVENGHLYTVVFQNELPPDTDCEIFFQQLWKQYHQNIAIEQRRNEKLQRQNVPLKFQRWIYEFVSINSEISLPTSKKLLPTNEAVSG